MISSTPSPLPLVAVTRGPVTESVHFGHIAITDSEGTVLHQAGNPDVVTYFRSAAKPLQALAVLKSGAGKKFDFSDREIAILCASHYGESFHLETVRGLLEKIGLKEENLLCGSATSLNPRYARELARNGVDPAPIYNDCSGKHAGILALCRHRQYPVEDYLSPDHPAQKEILATIADFCGLAIPSISIGVDGCSVPVFALPLSAMARAYARLTTPSHLERADRDHAGRIVEVMTANPEIIAGTGGFCTRLMETAGDKLIGKVGAEGIYCMGLREKDHGVAIKISDGAFRAVWPVAVETLCQMDILDDMELEALRSFHTGQNVNDRGRAVGEIRPVFTLR